MSVRDGPLLPNNAIDQGFCGDPLDQQLPLRTGRFYGLTTGCSHECSHEYGSAAPRRAADLTARWLTWMPCPRVGSAGALMGAIGLGGVGMDSASSWQ